MEALERDVVRERALHRAVLFENLDGSAGAAAAPDHDHRDPVVPGSAEAAEEEARTRRGAGSRRRRRRR